MSKSFVYLATSLTHVPEADRGKICELVDHLELHSRFLRWAFDVHSWSPAIVDNVYSYDLTLALAADFMAVVYLSSHGSDGRGVELERRASFVGRRGMDIYILEGVKVSALVRDMIKKLGLNPPKTFTTIQDLGGMILTDICANPAPKELASVRHRNRVLFREGKCPEHLSYDAMDLIESIDPDWKP